MQNQRYLLAAAVLSFSLGVGLYGCSDGSSSSSRTGTTSGTGSGSGTGSVSGSGSTTGSGTTSGSGTGTSSGSSSTTDSSKTKTKSGAADLVQEAVVGLAVAPAGPVAVVDLRRVPNTGT
jgi:hypothetical protein